MKFFNIQTMRYYQIRFNPRGKLFKFMKEPNFFNLFIIQAPGFEDKNNNNYGKVTLTVLQTNECDDSKTYPIPHNTYTKGKLQLNVLIGIVYKPYIYN